MFDFDVWLEGANIDFVGLLLTLWNCYLNLMFDCKEQIFDCDDVYELLFEFDVWLEGANIWLWWCIYSMGLYII